MSLGYKILNVPLQPAPCAVWVVEVGFVHRQREHWGENEVMAHKEKLQC